MNEIKVDNVKEVISHYLYKQTVELERCLHNEMLLEYVSKNDLRNRFLDRGFGVIMLAQELLGLPYEVANNVYKTYKEMISDTVDKN